MLSPSPPFSCGRKALIVQISNPFDYAILFRTQDLAFIPSFGILQPKECKKVQIRLPSTQSIKINLETIQYRDDALQLVQDASFWLEIQQGLKKQSLIFDVFYNGDASSQASSAAKTPIFEEPVSRLAINTKSGMDLVQSIRSNKQVEQESQVHRPRKLSNSSLQKLSVNQSRASYANQSQINQSQINQSEANASLINHSVLNRSHHSEVEDYTNRGINTNQSYYPDFQTQIVQNEYEEQEAERLQSSIYTSKFNEDKQMLITSPPKLNHEVKHQRMQSDQVMEQSYMMFDPYKNDSRLQDFKETKDPKELSKQEHLKEKEARLNKQIAELQKIKQEQQDELQRLEFMAEFMAKDKSKQPYNIYIWHLLLVSVIALICGACMKKITLLL